MLYNKFDKINFNSGEQILYVSQKGEVNFNDMLDKVEFLKSAEALPRKLRILEDALDSVSQISYDEIVLIAKKIDQMSEMYDYIRHAVIHNTPTNIAFSILTKEFIKSPKYDLRVFSNLELAKNWLID